MTTRAFATLLLFCALLVLLSCSEVRQPALSVTATKTELTAGESAQLTVTRQFPGGGPIEVVTNEVRYAVSPRDVIDVGADGLVTPLSEPGTADVRITDLKGSASAIIRFTVTPLKIIALRLEPAEPVKLAPGDTRRFGAVATLSDGSETNVTTSVAWESSNEAVAKVGKTQGDVGNVLGVKSGETTITASAPGTNVQARNVVTVEGDPPYLAAISLTPNPAVASLNVPFPFTAIGVYTNGKTEDLTHVSAWSSTDPTKAPVDANGIVLAVSAGTFTITAEDASGLIKGSAVLTVE